MFKELKMAILGETKKMLHCGSMYTFKRTTDHCWVCVDQGTRIIPESIIQELETPMGSLIGRTITRFWKEEKFVFERVARGIWECVYQDSDYIPNAFLDEINALN
jgi:ribosomal protein L37AE/L43A